MIMLMLAVLACNLPYQNPAADLPVMSEAVDGFRAESRVDGENLVRIIVPDRYFLGQSGADLSTLVDRLDETGVSVSVDVQSLISSTQDDILMWGYDTESAAEIPTSFVVIKNEEFSSMPLGLLSTFAGTLLGNNVQIVEQNRLTIGGRDTLRWITITQEAGYALTQAVYVFKDSGTLYLVGFNADRQEVYGQLAVYDSIVASLTIENLN
jgi:hypothetical protein